VSGYIVDTGKHAVIDTGRTRFRRTAAIFGSLLAGRSAAGIKVRPQARHAPCGCVSWAGPAAGDIDRLALAVAPRTGLGGLNKAGD
jgi:hypothetical protein